MKRMLNCLALLAGLVFFVPATPAVAQSGGGCNQVCDSAFCQWGGGGYCVQGYQGPNPVCYGFFDCPGGGFAAAEALARVLALDTDVPAPTACEVAALAEAAVGRFFRDDVFKELWFIGAREDVRLARSLTL